MDQQNILFDKYFKAIFSKANNFSEKEFELHNESFMLNYKPYLPGNKMSKILDVACGCGHFLNYLKKSGYTTYLGIDISPEQVDFCKKNVNQRVELADVFDYLKDKYDEYDVIVANDFIEHLPKKKVVEFLYLVNKCLKINGLFIAKTPNMGNPFSLYSRYLDFTHEVGFTEKSLFQILHTTNFTNVNILGFKNRFYFSPKLIIERAITKLIFIFITKAMQYQGFIAPTILYKNLVAVSYKKK